MSRRQDHRPAQARLAALAAVDLSVLCLIRPQPQRLLAIATHPALTLAQLGSDHLIALVAAAGVWLAAAWVGFGLLAALGAKLPGLAGRTCAHVAGMALPAAVRRIVIGAIGVGLLAGPVTAAAASPARTGTGTVATSRATSSATPTPGPSWPTSTPPTSTPPTSTPPTSTPPMTPSTTRQHTVHRRHIPTSGSTPAHRTRSDGDVRVRAGDSLWLIAAHRLGEDATPDQTATYWPQVYAANRGVVGPDPGLVTPGQVLHLPDPRSS